MSQSSANKTPIEYWHSTNSANTYFNDDTKSLLVSGRNFSSSLIEIEFLVQKNNNKRILNIFYLMEKINLECKMILNYDDIQIAFEKSRSYQYEKIKSQNELR